MPALPAGAVGGVEMVKKQCCELESALPGLALVLWRCSSAGFRHTVTDSRRSAAPELTGGGGGDAYQGLDVAAPGLHGCAVGVSLSDGAFEIEGDVAFVLGVLGIDAAFDGMGGGVGESGEELDAGRSTADGTAHEVDAAEGREDAVEACEGGSDLREGGDGHAGEVGERGAVVAGGDALRALAAMGVEPDHGAGAGGVDQIENLGDGRCEGVGLAMHDNDIAGVGAVKAAHDALALGFILGVDDINDAEVADAFDGGPGFNADLAVGVEVDIRAALEGLDGGDGARPELAVNADVDADTAEDALDHDDAWPDIALLDKEHGGRPFGSGARIGNLEVVSMAHFLAKPGVLGLLILAEFVFFARNLDAAPWQTLAVATVLRGGWSLWILGDGGADDFGGAVEGGGFGGA